MSKKIRLIRTIVKEYEPNPDYYPEGLSIEQMAELDANNDDVELMFDEVDEDEISWEIID